MEGQTIVLEVRRAEGRFERLPELVAELVGLKVDVLVAGGTLAVLAARNATQTIPIVTVVLNPVGLGLAASLSRPGGRRERDGAELCQSRDYREAAAAHEGTPAGACAGRCAQESHEP